MADPTATNLFGVPIGAGVESARQRMLSGVDPAAMAQANQGAPQSHKYEEQSGKHKGVAGTARNVLGFLGDFLLKKLGMPAMYAPGEEERKLNAAWQGHEEDPQAALDRVTDVNYNAGIKQADQYNDNQRLQAQQASTAELRDARVQAIQDTKRKNALGYAGSLINSTDGWSKEKLDQYWPQLRNQAISAGNRQGVDLSDDIPEKPDPIALNALLDAQVGVGTQRAQWITQNRDANNYQLGTDRNAQTKVRDQNATDDRKRGQDLNHDDKGTADDTKRRGQDIVHGDRGTAATETKRHNQVTEQRPHDGDVRPGKDGKDYIRRGGKWFVNQ